MAKGIWNQPGATERFLLYGTVDHAAIIYEHDAIPHVPGLEPRRSTPGPRTRGTHRLIPAKVRIRRAQEKTRSTASAEFRKKNDCVQGFTALEPGLGKRVAPTQARCGHHEHARRRRIRQESANDPPMAA